MTDAYDCIIIGAGPAGLTAAIYAARFQIKTLVIGKVTGGLANEAVDIQNWPGKIGSGLDIMNSFKDHVKKFGVEIKEYGVQEMKKEKDGFHVFTEKGENLIAKTLIIATGTERRKLNVPGEKELVGKGVAYCATCDAPFFKDKIVAIVGGGNAAAMGAQILTQYAKKVLVLIRREWSAEPARIEELENNAKVEIVKGVNVTEIIGKTKVEKIKLNNGKELKVDGIFIEIGGTPITALTDDLNVKLSESNKIIVNERMETSAEAVYAAGDVTTGSAGYQQIVTAAAEGALAALAAFNYIKNKKAGLKAH